MENTMTNEKLKTLITAGLMAALTCVGTMIIRIPTPTGGYIHPGDGFVLLSGLLLGPFWGFLAAGVGSALTDLIGGYFVYVPATFVIKGLTALVGYLVYKLIMKVFQKLPEVPRIAIAGVIGELVMVVGYFVYEIFMLADGFSGSALAAGAIAAAAGIPGNCIQAVFGVIIASVLFPILKKLAIN